MADRPDIRLPATPAVVAGVRHAAWLTPEGEIETIETRQAAERVRRDGPVMVCHAAAAARRLIVQGFQALDLLELFAFCRPAQFCLPTAKGLAEALGLPLPASPEAEAETLPRAALALLSELSAEGRGDTAAIAWTMERGSWAWASYVLSALGADPSGDGPHSQSAQQGIRVWQRLPDWEDESPPPPAGTAAVDGDEARRQLQSLLGRGSEKRPQQSDYAAGAARAFLPRATPGEPHMVLAEAGTGVGKTLGYIAPASLWAKKNQGTVWISTFTRNLQRQLDGELDRLYPDAVEKEKKVVVRKGRENYFCILNFQEAVGRATATGGREAVALGLIARWALATRDGDMIGGDFPAWLTDLLGRGMTTDLTDTRGECVYSACDHYGKCFIEHSQRRAKHAEIVVANHALVLTQAAQGNFQGATDGEGAMPLRYVFDEGHHLFSAADSAFSTNLSGFEAGDLRRWLIGAEEGQRSRSRGLRARLEDLIADDARAEEDLDDTLQAARALPGPGWRQRVADGTARGAAETFLALVRTQVLARTDGSDSAYSLETEPHPADGALLDAADKLAAALAALGKPLGRLIEFLATKLDDEADDLDTTTRNRIDALVRSIERRGLVQISAWRDMLKALKTETPADFVDWFSVERMQGRDIDVGFHRHFVDPTKPFADEVASEAHGILVTSATLRDRSDRDGGIADETDGWAGAAARTGAVHLPRPPARVAVPSPFDYGNQTRVFVVGDVNRNSPDQVSAAYRELFLASGGGALGLFTAINRLRAVHQRIAGPLEDAGLPLYAQHVDAMDTGTLIDIFRAEEDACLLGTDAVRDGVDVPGRSLRLIVFDRVPWPRLDILHRARRNAFGGRDYDEALTRLKLKQAFGRLIRRAGDRGVFVMLDRALPTRLTAALPAAVEIERTGLKEAVAGIRDFLAEA
ncbi:MAG: ATP-dependent DNA helicase [Rhodospirillaceae bacterium]